MTSSSPYSQVLHADQEHTGIRALVLLVLIVAVWISFWLMRLLLINFFPESDYIGILSCLGSLPLALVLVWAVEEWLKKAWPSGRKVTIDDTAVRATAPGQEEMILNLSGSLTHLSWFFQLGGFARGGRERRAPKNWLCLACQLQQDEHRLVTYAFFPMKKAAPLIEIEDPDSKFQQIFPAEIYDTSFRSRMGPPARPEIPASVLAGRDGRYWLAERRRWSEGFELTSDDFETFMRFVWSRQ